jgi:hypothetical protein
VFFMWVGRSYDMDATLKEISTVGTRFGTLMYLLIHYQAIPDKQKSDKPEAKKAEKVKFRRKQRYVRLHSILIFFFF